VSDADALKNILFVSQPHTISPVMRKYIAHPEVCGVLSQLAAAHLPFWDGSVKNVQSTLFVKPPLFQGQAWHQDELFIPTRDRSLIGASQRLPVSPAAAQSSGRIRRHTGVLWV
jgi:hypothetical protein